MENTKALKCRNCGAELDLRNANGGVIECEYCHSVFTLPKDETTPEALAFLRMGEHDLDTCNWDGAVAAYKKAWEKSKNEPEVFWGLALASYKVQYIKDVVNNRLQPICHEISTRKFTESGNYQTALKLATPAQRKEYEQKAAEIEYIKDEFYRLKQSGLNFDCFICVKVTDENGEKTEDYKDAEYIYDLLKNRGYSPFFSERSIRNRTGADYEAMILYALYSAETMLVVCRKEEYLQTRWVKNEYTRFLRLVNDEEKESDSITFVYYEEPIDRLPGRNGKLQGIDFSRRDADGKIIDFVENHTPEAKARREAAKRREKEEAAAQAKRFAEMQEQQQRQQQAIEEQKKLLEEQLNKLKNASTAPINGGVDLDALAKKMEAERLLNERKAEEERNKAEFLRNCVIENGEFKKFKGQDSEVVIPNDVISIGDEAFYGCESLKIVTIPNSVKRIGKNAFRDCINLTSITMPNSVKSIGEEAFCCCENLGEVVIPNSVTNIGDAAFSACYSLKCIIIPNSVTSIGHGTFSNCTKLTSITIPNSVKKIGAYAFRGCINLTSIIIPNSVPYIDDTAFWDCRNLTAESRKYIEQGKERRRAEEEARKRAEEEAYRKAKEEAKFKATWQIENGELKKYNGWGGEVVIPDCVTSIGINAFRYSNTLKSITIPASVTKIDGFAFEQCKKLISVTILGSTISIGSYAFYECVNLTTVTISGSVTSIGDKAFMYCSNLTIVDNPNGVREIGEYAFGHCYSLKSIIIPDDITRIGEGAFHCCGGSLSIETSCMIEKVENRQLTAEFNRQNVVRDGILIKYKGKGDFVKIPDGITRIGNEAFSGCGSVTTIIIPYGVTSIGDKAFFGCSKLTSVYIPKSVTSIGDKAFFGCSTLTSITIPNSVTSIGDGAFNGCNNLKSVTMPKALKDRRKDIFPKEILKLFGGCKFIYT